MKKTMLLAVVTAITGFIGLSQAQPYAAWDKYREITINTTGTGANVAGAVTNFPTLVRLSSASIAVGANVLSEALANGADVRFTDSSGNTALAYEIDGWNATSAEIWVKIPAIAGNSNTKIRLYWGNAAAAAASDGNAVFDTANGFVGVWHLGNAAGIDPRPNAVQGAPTAKPSNNAAGASFGGGAGTYVAPNGAIGKGDNLRGGGTRNAPEATSDYLNIGSGADNTASPYTGTNTYTGYSNFSTGLTYSIWSNAGTPAGNYTYLFELANTTNNNRNIQLFRPVVETDYRYEHVPTTTSGSTNWKTTPSGSLVEGVWQHVFVTVGTGTTPSVSMYVDGALLTGPVNQAAAAANILRTNAWIGKSNYTGDIYWTGAFDEARIAKVARSADWAKLEYETQKPTATAVTLGTTQSTTARALYYPVTNAVYILNAAIENNVPVVSGAVTGSYAIVPDSLPTGLSFNTTTGVISGTPTVVAAAKQFIVTATVGGNPASDTLSIAVSAGTPPGAPTGASATLGSSSATVTWVAPSSSGTAAITSYVVRAVEDTTKTCTWTTGALSCTVSGLTNGTSYTFVVRAVSAVGSSAYSAPSSAVIPSGPPSAPLNVTASQAGTAASVKVNWSAPASTGGQDISDYYVTASPGGLQCYGSPFVTPLTCTITGLSYNVAYTFTVVAANPMGNGPSSAPSNSVTPVGIAQGPFAIQVTGSAKPFTFALTSEAMASTEALTMTISDVYGRTVWSKTVNPKSDLIRELRWNSTTSTGRAVSAGVYMVRVSAVSGGQTSDFIQKAVSDK